MNEGLFFLFLTQVNITLPLGTSTIVYKKEAHLTTPAYITLTKCTLTTISVLFFTYKLSIPQQP